MERSFFDSAPEFAELGFPEVRGGIHTEVLAVGQHQFIREGAEGFAGDAEVVGFDAAVLDAQDH